MTTALLNQLLMIFILAAIGYIARKTGLISEQVQNGLSAIVLNITIPASILASAAMPFQESMTSTILIVALGGAIIHLVAILLNMALARPLKLQGKRRAVFITLASFSNVAFIGFPVITAFLPDSGVFLTSFFIISFNAFFFTYGYAVLSGSRKISPRSIVTNVNIIALLIMLILYLAQIKLPTAVQNVLDSLGSMSTPLSLIVIGGMMANIRIRELFNTPLLYLVSFLKLIVLPTLVFGAARLLSLPAEPATVLLVMSALPSATMNALAANRFDCEADLSSKGVLQSTLFFAASVFYVSLLVGML